MAAEAERHGLGVLRDSVQNRPRRRPRSTAAPACAAAVGVAVAGVALAVHRGGRTGGWYGWLPVCVGTALALWFVAGLRRTPRPRKTWVARFENGVVHRVGDAEPRAYAWDDIRAVAQHDARVVRAFRSSTGRSLLIVPLDGDLICVNDSFDGAGPFAERLTVAFARARAPREMVRLRAGEQLRFGGQLAVDEGGVGACGQRVDWHDVERIAVGPEEVLHVFRHGQQHACLSVPAAGMPNLPVFLTLAEELRRRAAA
ncbi:DUF6585 family protein [Streptacidiphilus melanogenes]|uniref:DUF6585 family protein n=1 Tax=Streptacidiphilus melanogenes TaxID=411235 RepID=UPI001269F030|nr:DUF6585 family protein [Streptacidiphilus melanogenes]